MNIGDTVTYCRFNQDGFSEGSAVLRGIGLDGAGHLIALLKEGESSFNAFHACLNRDKAFHEHFKAEIERIQEVGKEGNAKAKAIVDEYNARTAEMYNALVGNPIKD